MGDHSKIEWTDATWNPVTGCTRVSEGCRNCYMARVVPRQGQDPWTVVLHPDRLDQPLRWKHPRRIFVNSLSDLFHADIPDSFILDCFRTMKKASQHVYQVLTKRPDRMRDFMQRLGQEDGELFLDHLMGGMTPHIDHIWLGVSVEDQKTADARIPLLLQTPAAVRFVSYEPALGPVDFFHIKEPSGFTFNALSKRLGIAFRGTGLDWLICGGESGPGARPMHPDWARSLRDQCQRAGTPFFFKQWGEWVQDQDARNIEGCHGRHWQVTENGKTVVMVRIGKKKAGRLLDGREWNEFPKVTI